MINLNFANKGDFAINFETFAKIFAFKTPHSFLDFLFMYGGVEMPGLQYAAVNTQMIEPPPPEIKHKRMEEDKYSIVLDRINRMKDFHATTRTFRYRTE